MASASLVVAIVGLVVAILSFAGTLTLGVIGYLHTMKPKLKVHLSPVVMSEEAGGGIRAISIDITNVRPVPVTIEPPLFVLPDGTRVLSSQDWNGEPLVPVHLLHGETSSVIFSYKAIHKAYSARSKSATIAIQAEIMTRHGVVFRSPTFETSELPPPPSKLMG